MNQNIAESVYKKGAKRNRELAENRFQSMDKTCFYCLQSIKLKDEDKVFVKKRLLYCSKKCAALGRWRKKKLLEKFKATNVLPLVA